MQADVKASALENFQETRDDYAKYLEGLSNGDNGGRGTISLIEAKLRSLSNTLSMWTLIREGTEKEGKCFEERCENLSVLMEELATMVECAQHTLLRQQFYAEEQHILKLFKMAAMQVGSLTLHGFSTDDMESARNARLIELEQRRWELKFVWEDDSRRAMLRTYWFRFYYKVHDCLCGQCLDVYMHTREPTLSPPLPPCLKRLPTHM
ncbi:hypothetical protein N7472_004379 [Penicillium cf. griseofulvum]|uniref:Uncharacterized protein n=1 Tax=Penicillium cf. griseofulvum TaxID=2972120 RepID=A0A9W9JLK4_9EURO|nr:hypothetical protein N7472_004379 [Penicillium cf. griseofulvum]KAJ5441938.1 hypothetical protein N7445_004945 [Penicillium cf. griseofulvum]